MNNFDNNLKQEKEQFYMEMIGNINLYRETLQKLILYYMYYYQSKKGEAHNLVFMGGTNLRLVYNLPRWSEDLDFAFLGKNNHFAFKGMVDFVVEALQTKHFLDVSLTKVNKNTNVWKNFYVFSFTGVSKRKLKIKLEVDVNPPLGGQIDNKTISNTFFRLPFFQNFKFPIFNYDINTTFIGKIGAIVGRKYLKGRDIFDIWWYTTNYFSTKDIEYLNLTYYNNIVKQIKENDPNSDLEFFEISIEGGNNFINFITKKIYLLLSTEENKRKILEDLEDFVFEDFVFEDFKMALNNRDFLIKLNSLHNLPVK